MKNRINTAKKLTLFLISMAAFLIISQNLLAQNMYVPDTTLTHKERKAAKKEFLKKQLHASKSRLIIKGDYVFAHLNTQVKFTGPKDVLSATIKLEENLGLPQNRAFFSGSVLYRFNPSSGLYAQYYGLNRESKGSTDQDYIFLGDTIKAGTNHTTFFNTQVFSLGYLLSILQHRKAVVGVYFNVYIMALKTGISADIDQINAELNTLLPLPNFGIVGTIHLKNWLAVGGNLGLFGLSISSFGGYITTFAFEVTFKPIHWLGIDVKYESFDVAVDFKSNEIDTQVDYKFHGPAVGLTLEF